MGFCRTQKNIQYVLIVSLMYIFHFFNYFSTNLDEDTFKALNHLSKPLPYFLEWRLCCTKMKMTNVCHHLAQKHLLNINFLQRLLEMCASFFAPSLCEAFCSLQFFSFSFSLFQGNKCLHQRKPAHPPNQPHIADLQNCGLACTPPPLAVTSCHLKGNN